MSDDEILEPEALETEDIPASEDEEVSSDTDPEELELQEAGEDEGEEDQEDEDQDVDENDTDGDPELEDYEFEGQTYKVPSALKPQLMMNADYTRKTQEVAEERKALKGREEALNQQAETQRALIGDYAQLHNINNELHQLQNTDWQKLKAEDPFAPQEVMLRIQQLQNDQRRVAAGIQHKEHQRTVAAQQETAKREQKFQESLINEIPGWSNDLGTKLTNFASATYKVSADELTNIRDVRFVKLLRDAKEGQELKERMQKQKLAAKKPKPKPDAKPLAKPSAKGRGSAKKGLSDDMSAEEWAAMRNKQVAARSRF